MNVQVGKEILFVHMLFLLFLDNLYRLTVASKDPRQIASSSWRRDPNATGGPSLYARNHSRCLCNLGKAVVYSADRNDRRTGCPLREEGD